MTRRRSTEQALRNLNEVKASEDLQRLEATLRDALEHRSSHVVARAASIAGERELKPLGEDLEAAFLRHLRGAARTDKGCRAKIEIARAFLRLGWGGEEALLQGARHVQREPVWGRPVDTAAELREICLLALVGRGHPEALTLLADGLADPEARVRQGAARAAASCGSPAAAPLIRLRIRTGDPEPGVLTECLVAALALDPETTLPLAGELLEDPDRAEAAATALGASRLPAAWPLLRRWWENLAEADLRATALQAMALLRLEEPLEFLLELLERESPRIAREVLSALEPYSGDPAVQERIDAILARRPGLDAS